MDQAAWDELYGDVDRVWSGAVNGALAVEATDLEPGRALDVGSGEGGDARWLAERGWRVTATDISAVAVARARAATRGEQADRIDWVRADLTTDPPEPGGYDLVSLMYFPLLRSLGPTAVHAIADAVAPGGLLLVVGHDLSGHEHDHGHGDPATPGADDTVDRDGPSWRGPDPAEFLRPDEIAAMLGEGWDIETLATRPRIVPASGAGVGHVDDVILRARRRN